jgi:hypothetical protein
MYSKLFVSRNTQSSNVIKNEKLSRKNKWLLCQLTRLCKSIILLPRTSVYRKTSSST